MQKQKSSGDANMNLVGNQNFSITNCESMMYRAILLIGIAFLAVQCVNRANQQAAEPVEESETTILFDGSTTDHWRDTKSEHFPEHGWVVDGDVLMVMGEREGQPGGHDIITKKLYGNFDLELEVKLSEGANSGIKYVVINTFPGKEGSFLGLEYQLLDNSNRFQYITIDYEK